MIYSVEPNGSIRFSRHEYKEMQELFYQAGISIQSLKTYEDYLCAREKAAPYFLSWIEATFEKRKNDHSEYRLIYDALFE